MVRYRWRVGDRTGGGSAAMPRLFIGIFLLVGLGLLGGSAYLTYDTRRALSVGVRADGEVTDLYENRDSDGDITYRPRVRFRTREGDSVEFTSSVGSHPAAFGVGETVAVIYNPASPDDARIDSFFQLWFAPLLLGGMGVVFTGFGCLAMRTGQGRASTEEKASDVVETMPATARTVDRRSRD